MATTTGRRGRSDKGLPWSTIGAVLGALGGIAGLIGGTFGVYSFVTKQFVPRWEYDALKVQVAGQTKAAEALGERLKKPEGLAQDFESLKTQAQAAIDGTSRIREALTGRHVVFALDDCISGGNREASCQACCEDLKTHCIVNCAVDPHVGGPWCICGVG